MFVVKRRSKVFGFSHMSRKSCKTVRDAAIIGNEMYAKRKIRRLNVSTQCLQNIYTCKRIHMHLERNFNLNYLIWALISFRTIIMGSLRSSLFTHIYILIDNVINSKSPNKF